jgi:hypothetical protein
VEYSDALTQGHKRDPEKFFNLVRLYARAVAALTHGDDSNQMWAVLDRPIPRGENKLFRTKGDN